MTVSRIRVYLASRSPRRRELLRQIGVEFELLLLREAGGRPIDVDESRMPGEPPGDYALRVARAKADAGWRSLIERRMPRRYPPYPLIAADTTVAVDGEVLGKPGDGAEATRMLRLLSGRSHEVYTAVAMAWEENVDAALSVSTVSFRELSDAEILAYVASGEPMDKAGAYGIQGLGAVFVSELRGSHSAVVGLPLHETAELLRARGFRIL